VEIGRAVHGELRNGERVIDDPIVAWIAEDIADVNMHGGPWVVKAVCDLARRSGFEIADAPHFPLADGAVDAEDALEQEILTHLPLATTELAIRVLLDQRRAWRRNFRRLLNAKRILRDRSLWWLLHPPRVAIVGAANVGKSTLANQLFAQERSITADVPGTTRDWVGETANIDGLAVTLIDTPGVRVTPDEIERAAIDKSQAVVGQADLVIVVLDATRMEDAEQQTLLASQPHSIVVLNKVDRAKPPTRDLCAISTVATSGAGVPTLRREIRRLFGCLSVHLGRPRWWTNRQCTMLTEQHLPTL
jgi:tRNA modification GTPase